MSGWTQSFPRTWVTPRCASASIPRGRGAFCAGGMRCEKTLPAISRPGRIEAFALAVVRLKQDRVRFPIGHYGNSERLLASEVALVRLDGDVADQKLDLVQVAPARWQRRAQVRRRSCGASLSIPARAAAARTTSRRTLGDMPSPKHARPC